MKKDRAKDHGEAAGIATRRGFLLGAGGAIAGAGLTGGAAVAAAPATAPRLEPFHGRHQAGIVTPQQSHSYFLAFDLTSGKRDDLVRLLRDWTAAAARMAGGETAAILNKDADAAPLDSGEALDLAPARLTLTVGFGAGLFAKDGKDRYGLAAQRPEALIDLPRFNGDQLVEARTGGDLSLQACAEDPQVAFHAARQLARLAYGVAEVRWAQSGFLSSSRDGGTPRNLMGFKDGTQVPENIEEAVWVGSEGPAWMRNGSYLVARRIRISLEHWDRTELSFQEEVVGRHKYSGAPLGKKDEKDALDLDRTDADGNPVIPETAHVRLAAAASNGGAQIFRRGYSYNDGVSFTAERWPPWRQGMMYDSGLFFIAYQRDPRRGFVPIFERMSKLDMMNQYVTHVGGGLFACPGGTAEGEFIGQRLFDSV
ncbi:MAG TPA: iron uptake transporter deferrochelatase/peroxidase subunit [Stellaceae bacterium]|nr:iron uptake transporter deferrochelatase/peroxidase subunit [Stellaceae bacterium]